MHRHIERGVRGFPHHPVQRQRWLVHPAESHTMLSRRLTRAWQNSPTRASGVSVRQ
jgi:hypothetical protein